MPIHVGRGSMLLLSVFVAFAQWQDYPSGMRCGGNQVIIEAEKPIHASTVSGRVSDPSGAEMPGAWVQVQRKGSKKLIVDTTSDQKGRFHINLPPGVYWLGVSSPGMNLHIWTLSINRDSGFQKLKVKLSVGT